MAKSVSSDISRKESWSETAEVGGFESDSAVLVRPVRRSPSLTKDRVDDVFLVFRRCSRMSKASSCGRSTSICIRSCKSRDSDSNAWNFRFMATIGVASGSAAHVHSVFFDEQTEQTGRKPSHCEAIASQPADSYEMLRRKSRDTLVFLLRHALQATGIWRRLALLLVGESSLAEPELRLDETEFAVRECPSIVISCTREQSPMRVPSLGEPRLSQPHTLL